METDPGNRKILACGAAAPAAPEHGEKPAQQRPETPEFWDQRFTTGVMPWDAGRIPGGLAAFAARQAGKPRTLIPGCGSAYEAAYLDDLGWQVTALDFSAAAIAAARSQLEDFSGELLQADFFAFAVERPYELIYERAFLCALPRRLWSDYGRRCAELLAPGGLLAGFFFFDESPKGPPFGTTPAALEALLGPHFELIETAAVEDSVNVFAGRERWLVWRRRSATG